MKRIILVILLVAVCVSATAQRSRTRREEVQFLYNNAYVHQKEYRPDEAMRCLRLLLKIDSTFIPAHNLMGWVYEDAYANYDSALICYQKTIDLDSHYVKGYVNLGHIHYLRREYFLATQYNTRAIHIDSNYADAYFNLGVICNERNYLHDAYRFMRQAADKGSRPAKEWLRRQEERQKQEGGDE